MPRGYKRKRSTGKVKVGLEFDGFKEYAERLDKLGGDLMATTEKALIASHDYVTPTLHRDMEPHMRSGLTEESIIDNVKVEWEGMTASVDVGFNIEKGGPQSIFLMYGTPRHQPANQYGKAGGENPGFFGDSKLHGDLYAKFTRYRIQSIQENIFAAAIKQRMEG